ncbi:GyrI-like domain-containing protein [Enterococcus dongliensis]|uniref:GyrI-like domain-containing protein n=1 Tax=Enterococcus dongliensis TaxID=2559925 RepID=UPI00288DF851|nr:GyrI-like domain-containing protein [Enterococcus dongliensis]MDT2603312.1 GyrI-like domain-containing protein [Enterococcus dongliensis]MDT2612715.1 GyrI-like domain-containing protein [Enterococcus dongliensis]MDT2639774.1 GyrI-like domain-containing protein [Enterococcus dongliensis]MDT2644162.1 GyrI-like domain-containing protein [Enterococcus dongliensis]MDT2669433.1 GyrI-like domain-containing protein [Enterococcus dongliensis]
MKIKGVNRVDLPTLFVIGKEGRGLAEEGASWVPLLWDQVNVHFEELTEVLNDQEINELHLWGLMSDGQDWLAPWQEEGRYLAGVQVPETIEAPEGWVRWELPPMSYLTVMASAEKIEAATNLMLGEIFPLEKVTLAGAIQEHYLPHFAEGEVELYFPFTAQ